jgi:hypothetical protein
MESNEPKKIEYTGDRCWLLYRYKLDVLEKIESKDMRENLVNRPLKQWNYSSINQYDTILANSYHININTVETVVVTYRIKNDKNNKKNVIYALGYLNIKNTQSENLAVEFNYVCSGGSMISKDGEYRSGLIDFNCFFKILNDDVELLNLFTEIKDYLDSKISKRNIMVLMDFYFPNMYLKRKSMIKAELMCAERKLDLLAISWFRFFYSYSFGIISNHLNKSYKDIFIKHKREDGSFFNSLLKSHGERAINKLRYVCNELYGEKPNDIYSTKIGQKVIPLSLIEIQNPFNIQYRPWKELLINSKLTDLVINRVTNGFPIQNNWLFIKNKTHDLFDNPSQRLRIEKGAITKKITDILKQALIYSLFNIEDANRNKLENGLLEDKMIESYIDAYLTKKSNKSKYTSKEHINNSVSSSWVENDFKTLYNKIQDAISYTKEYMIISNTVLCIIGEYVGKTMYDSVFFSQSSDYYKKLVKNPFYRENYSHFKKYMFQICYNLLCINSKLGIIHGDLHLNNMTINPLIYKKNMDIEIKNPKIMYSFSDEQYVFDNNFYNLCIIDFSRAIINPSSQENLMSPEISKIYDIIRDKTTFFKKQTKTLIKYLIDTKPEFKSLEMQLYNVFMYNFDAVFKVLTALDIYNVSSKFIMFIENINLEKEISKASVDLIQRINKIADNILSVTFNNMLEKRDYGDIEWPAYTIIKEVFYEDTFDRQYEEGKVDYDNITDVFNFNAPLKHSLSRLSDYPEHIREVKAFKNNSVKKPSAALNKRFNGFIQKRKEYEMKRMENYNIINQLAKTQKEKNI